MIHSRKQKLGQNAWIKSVIEKLLCFVVKFQCVDFIILFFFEIHSVEELAP